MSDRLPPVERIEPGPGQESVWDYPRPPRIERSDAHVVVQLGGRVIADTTAALRVLETSHPPVFYVSRARIAADVLVGAARTTWCEFKGVATYFDVMVGGRTEAAAAWTYREPLPGFELLLGHVAFYPARMDACFVDDERVQPQEGDFYGGWVTSKVVGPFKGGIGTYTW
jgi:uncharacterized protein (DUF427 family)